MKNHWLKNRIYWAILEYQDNTRTYPEKLNPKNNVAILTCQVEKKNHPRQIIVYNDHCNVAARYTFNQHEIQDFKIQVLTNKNPPVITPIKEKL